ncbi:MAG: SOS response-associated peptidase family protein [Burkholderiales bacterium]|nr:SOS response-associated peptidase family protein [Burkholderiales bacterium]
MCGRYELHTRTSEIARRFDARLVDLLQEGAPRYNVAPSTAVPVATEDYARWLDPAVDSREAIEAMMRPCPAELMRTFPVSTRVNDVRNDDAAVLAPLLE